MKLRTVQAADRLPYFEWVAYIKQQKDKTSKILEQWNKKKVAHSL